MLDIIPHVASLTLVFYFSASKIKITLSVRTQIFRDEFKSSSAFHSSSAETTEMSEQEKIWHTSKFSRISSIS